MNKHRGFICSQFYLKVNLAKLGVGEDSVFGDAVMSLNIPSYGAISFRAGAVDTS